MYTYLVRIDMYVRQCIVLYCIVMCIVHCVMCIVHCVWCIVPCVLCIVSCLLSIVHSRRGNVQKTRRATISTSNASVSKFSRGENAIKCNILRRAFELSRARQFLPRRRHAVERVENSRTARTLACLIFRSARFLEFPSR